jgi:hypothetical protein
MYLPGELLEFLIRDLEVLELGPEPGPLEMGIFQAKFSQIWDFLCSIP